MDVDIPHPQPQPQPDDAPSRVARRAVHWPSLNPRHILSLDLFYEICSYLDPRDLLHLLRTSQALRHSLRSRTSTALWSRCLNTWPGLPACTDWLNGPRYAWLAFENTCQHCGKDIDHSAVPSAPFWTLAMRFCRPCQRIDTNVTGLISVPSTRVAGVALGDLVRTAIFFEPPWLPNAWLGQECTLPKLLEELLYEWSNVPEANQRQYLAMRREMVEQAKEYSSSFSEFRMMKCHTMGYEKARETIVERRMRMIRVRFYKSHDVDVNWPIIYNVISWDEKFGHVAGERSLSRHPLVDVPKHLTDSEWDNMKADLVDHITKVLSPIYDSHREDLVWERRLMGHRAVVSTLHSYWDDAVPVTASVADMMDFPSFKKLVEVPPYEDVTPATFQEGRPPRASSLILKDIGKWSDDILLKLFWHVGLFDPYADEDRADVKELWPGAPPPEIDGEDTERYFWLATSVFFCTGSECRRADGESAFRRRVAAQNWDALLFPFVMNHVCLRGRLLPPPEGERHPVPVRWSPDTIVLHKPLRALITGIVRTCGLDPRDATHEDMDDDDARLVCGHCASHLPLGELSARTWWRSTLHYIDAHKDTVVPENMTWLRLSKRAERLVRKIAPPPPTYWRQRLRDGHYPTHCTACPVDEEYDLRAIHRTRMEEHWAQHHADVMLDEGQRMGERAWVARQKEPAGVPLNMVQKHLGISRFEEFFNRDNDGDNGDDDDEEDEDDNTYNNNNGNGIYNGDLTDSDADLTDDEADL